MEDVSLAFLCTVLSVSISFLTFQRNGKKDIKEDSIKLAEIKAKLDYIVESVDEIKADNKGRDSLINSLENRISRVEEVLRSTLKRQDILEEEVRKNLYKGVK